MRVFFTPVEGVEWDDRGAKQFGFPLSRGSWNLGESW